MINEDLWSVTTEYLILHEDELDWDELSKKRQFSLVEIRLFRKRINWTKYLYKYCSVMSSEMLEIASKYFNLTHYMILGINGNCSEEFVLNHLNDFTEDGVNEYILSAAPSEEFLLKTVEYWKDKEDISKEIQKYIDSENYPSVSLLFEIE